MFAGLSAHMSSPDPVSLKARAWGWWGSLAGPLDSPKRHDVKNRVNFYIINYIKRTYSSKISMCVYIHI